MMSKRIEIQVDLQQICKQETEMKSEKFQISIFTCDL